MLIQLLVADSDPFIRERCRGYFGQRGYQVETAADALECLGLLHRIPPDVLVVERELLWGGGDGVLAYLRENRCRWPQTVILTTTQTNSDVPRLQTPLKAVLKEPFSVATLFEAIRRAEHRETQLAARFLQHAKEVAEMEKYRRQWGPPFGPSRPSSFKGGV